MLTKTVNTRSRVPIKLDSATIEGFAGSCLVPYFDNPTPFKDFHRELWELCTSNERFVAICAPRRHSKSTTVTIVYTLAALLFRQRKYAVIVSDTESQSTLFVGQIKQILYDSKDIQEMFGIAINDKGEPDFEKDTNTDFILSFKDGAKMRVVAKGAEQKLRGLLWDGSRPDLIVVDDILNEELVMNKDRRDKLRRWFYGSLIPCRSKDGIIRFVGTPMNADDILESLMPSTYSKNTIHTPLRTTQKTKLGMWKVIKYRAHTEDFSQILWPEMHSRVALEELKKELTDQGIPEVYSCEMLCDPVDDSVRLFKPGDIHDFMGEDRKKDLTYYVSADFAISTADKADWTVFMIGGMDSNGMLYIKDVIRDRMDGLTIVQTMLSLQRRWKPVVFGIEEGQISKTIGPFLDRMMMEENTYLSVEPLRPHKTDKVSRSRSIQARMRAGAVRFDKDSDWYSTLEHELLQFPRGKHDDQVDALSYLGLIINKMVEGRTEKEMADEEYMEEYREFADEHADGRSAVTGY
jgi:predicted phage terminase large subunit-like protein